MLEKCTKDWLRNVLLIHNLPGIKGISTCVSHTYYSAVDFQLFVVALLVVVLIMQSKLFGIVTALALVAFGNLEVYNKTVSGISPILLFKEFSPKQMMDYFDHVHLQTSTYLPHYFGGIIVGWATQSGYRLRNKLWMWIAFGLYVMAEWSTSLMNTFNLVTPRQYGYYALLSRNLYILAASIAVLHANRQRNRRDEKTSETNVATASNSTNASYTSHSTEHATTAPRRGMTFSALKALSQLSFAMYMTNVWFLRTDVFVSRTLLQNSPYPFIKRMIYSLYFIILFSLYFHIVFVAPFNNIRKLITRSRTKPSEAGKEKQQ